MPEEQEVGHIMVREPVCASLWQPISFVRQTLLANSFSYLPVRDSEGPDARWGLISDFAIATYLRAAKGEGERSRRLAKPLVDVLGADDGIRLDYPYACGLDESIVFALANSEGKPVLVVGDNGSTLLGLATSFDML